MTIAEFAKITGLSSYTLRYYEKIGIMPTIHRDRSGMRNYTQENVERVRLVQQLKCSGMSLENILTYLQTMGQSKKAAKIRREVLLKTKDELVAKSKGNTRSFGAD